MRIKAEHKKFLANELIGKQVFIANSRCIQWIGLSGSIVDETLHTFLIETHRGQKRISKKSCVWFFPSINFSVDGKLLNCRSEDRTKKFKC